VDARQVPFAWTPPGRVFVGVDLERTALLGPDGVQEGRGRWGGEAGSAATFRRTKIDDPFEAVPISVADGLERDGAGVLAIDGARGLIGVPVRWRAEEHALYAALPAETLAIADAAETARVALTIDRASVWRARDMVGAMFQGEATFFAADHVGSGAKTLRAIARDMDPNADALVRIVPDRVVWWEGWTSGSARLA
jgi:hypothetical protein